MDISKLSGYLKNDTGSSTAGSRFQPRTPDGRYTFGDLKRRVISAGVTSLLGTDVSGYIPGVNKIGQMPPSSNMNYNPGLSNNQTPFAARTFGFSAFQPARQIPIPQGNNVIALLKSMNENVNSSLNNIGSILNRINSNINSSSSNLSTSLSNIGSQLNKSNQFLSVIASNVQSNRYKKDIGNDNNIQFQNKTPQLNIKNEKSPESKTDALSSILGYGEDAAKVGGGYLLGKSLLKGRLGSALGAAKGAAGSALGSLGGVGSKLFPEFGKLFNKALPFSSRFGASIPLLGDIYQGYSSYKESGSLGRGLAAGLGSLGGRAAFGVPAAALGPLASVGAQVGGSYAGSSLANSLYDKWAGGKNGEKAKQQIEQKKQEVQQQELQKIELKSREITLKGDVIKFEANKIDFGKASLGRTGMGMGSSMGGMPRGGGMIAPGVGGSTGNVIRNPDGSITIPQNPAIGSGGAFNMPGLPNSAGIQAPNQYGGGGQGNGIPGLSDGRTPSNRQGPNVQMPHRGGQSSGGTIPGLSPAIPGTTHGQSEYRLFDSKSTGLMKELMSRYNISKESAAAIVGNLGHESNGFKSMQEQNPTAGRGGLGWAQWTGSRRRDFERWAKSKGLDPYSDEANKGFLFHELDTQYKDHIQTMEQRGGSIANRTRFWEHKFERSADYDQNTGEILKPKHDQSRINYANRALGLFDGTINPVNAQQRMSVVGNAAKFGTGDPRIAEILRESSKYLPEGYRGEIYSGVRPGDRRFHGQGMANDMRIIDPKGNAISNYQNPENFRIYEQFAQHAKKIQTMRYPELNNDFRWGGYFSGGRGTYGAMDLMHFDIGGRRVGMGGGSWEQGLTPKQRALYGNVPVSQGMGNIADFMLPQTNASERMGVANQKAPEDVSQRTFLNYAGIETNSAKTSSQSLQQESEDRAVKKENAPPPMLLNAPAPGGGKIIPQNDKSEQDVKVNEPLKYHLDSKRDRFADYYK